MTYLKWFELDILVGKREMGMYKVWKRIQEKGTGRAAFRGPFQWKDDITLRLLFHFDLSYERATFIFG